MRFDSMLQTVTYNMKKKNEGLATCTASVRGRHDRGKQETKALLCLRVNFALSLADVTTGSCKNRGTFRSVFREKHDARMCPIKAQRHPG